MILGAVDKKKLIKLQGLSKNDMWSPPLKSFEPLEEGWLQKKNLMFERQTTWHKKCIRLHFYPKNFTETQQNKTMFKLFIT